MDDLAPTPLLRQYQEIKKSYPDAILFFRLGDFYEMFFDDARVAAPILEVVLTSRNKNKDGAVPLCGVPHHAWENYAAKLLRKGYKVAICEQMEDPALAKGIVRREVTHILTPATALEVEALDAGLNSFIVVVRREGAALALASLDLAVGDFEVRAFAAGSDEALFNELTRRFPREIVIARSQEKDFAQFVRRFPEFADVLLTAYDDAEFAAADCAEVLRRQFALESLEGLGMQEHPQAVGAAGVAIKYLRSIRPGSLPHLGAPRFSAREEYLVLDAVSFRNLEVVANLRNGGAAGSLFAAVDMTVTPMGRRLLRKWLTYPLLDRATIERRLDGVDEFAQNLVGRSEVRKKLKSFADLARLNSRVALNIAQPQHLLSLRDTLARIPAVLADVQAMQSGLVREAGDGLRPLPEVVELVERAIAEEPAAALGEGQVIRAGFHAGLDELRAVSRDAKAIVAAMERREREATGIPSLKIKYNKVFGYFIEVTKPHLHLVPERYMRKQTLVNAERFLTAELKELEEKILKAEERIGAIERSLYFEVLSGIQRFSPQLNGNADQLALLDVLSAAAELAQRRGYVRPEVNDGAAIRVQEGRHPVVEAASGRGFIPNDLGVAADSEQILLITGPNMARRDRPRHLDLRRPFHRLGRGRVPARDEGAATGAVRHPLPRADRAGRRPRARAQLPHRGQGVAGQRHLPAQDHARPHRPELRHPRGQDRRHPAPGHRAGQGHPAQPGEEGAEPPGQGAHHRPHPEGAARQRRPLPRGHGAQGLGRDPREAEGDRHRPADAAGGAQHPAVPQGPEREVPLGPAPGRDRAPCHPPGKAVSWGTGAGRTGRRREWGRVLDGDG